MSTQKQHIRIIRKGSALKPSKITRKAYLATEVLLPIAHSIAEASFENFFKFSEKYENLICSFSKKV